MCAECEADPWLAAVYRQARRARQEKMPPYDVEAGLKRLLAWMGYPDGEVPADVADPELRARRTREVPVMAYFTVNCPARRLLLCPDRRCKGPMPLVGAGGISAVLTHLRPQGRYAYSAPYRLLCGRTQRPPA
jgi:hypothetical protein